MSVYASTTLGELAKALSAMQADLEPARKEAVNPHFRSRYADLAACLEAVRAPMAKHGLALSQHAGLDGDVVTLTTLLLHTSGEFLQSTAGVRLAKHDAPSVGSALTYLRRYALSAVVGLSAEADDDGAAAMAPAPVQAPRAPSPELQRAAQKVEATFQGSTTTFTPHASGTGDDPSCPTCGGRMWDNRGTPEKPKTNPKAPDYKCRDKSCDGVIWPPRGPRKQERMQVVEPTMPVGPDEEIPY
jgi:hypothetical protein